MVSFFLKTKNELLQEHSTVTVTRLLAKINIVQLKKFSFG